MPALSNPRHEHFASLVAAGETPTRAYVSAGYSPKGAATSALRLRKNTEICARIAELSTAVAERSVERAAVDRAWVLAHLKENVARAMQAIPVKDAEGNVIGDYKWEGAVANRGLELIGKELGMFRERVDMKLEADVNNVSMTLAAVLSTEELLVLEAKLLAAQQQQQLPAAMVRDRPEAEEDGFAPVLADYRGL
jgi:hypothetical protein